MNTLERRFLKIRIKKLRKLAADYSGNLQKLSDELMEMPDGELMRLFGWEKNKFGNEEAFAAASDPDVPSAPDQKLRFSEDEIKKGMISAIIPTYNRADVLHRSVDSILAQTYTNFELLIVDDGSEDNTPEICRAYAEKDPRVRIIRQENGGVSRARNTGIRESRGEFLYFLDSDDVASPHILERLHDDLVRYDADFVCCRMLPTEEYVQDFEEFSEKQRKMSWKDVVSLLFDDERYNWNVGAKLTRRERLADPKPLFFMEDCQFSEDSRWMLELLARTRSCVVDDSRLLLYKLNSEGSLGGTATNAKIFWHSRKFVQYMEAHGFPQRLIDERKAFAVFHLSRVLLSGDQ